MSTITAIDYGKANVTAYRFNAKPLQGITPIPESSFQGRENTLFGVDVDVQVLGDNFVPAYTEGDNRNVVATDTMKNFILKKALEWEGDTLEHFLAFLGKQFLTTYPEMEALQVMGREVPFDSELLPEGDGFNASPVLFSRSRNDFAAAELSLEREGDEIVVVDHQCARLEHQLIKTTGSSFTSFVRDEHTTLPEMHDRPLFIYLDVFWRYAEVQDALSEDHTRYVAAEQVRDVIASVFHDLNSKSIQHLVYEMGKRLLERFSQLEEVRFEAQNRLWDRAFESDGDPTRKVHTDPRPPFGQIGLTMRQGDE